MRSSAVWGTGENWNWAQAASLRQRGTYKDKMYKKMNLIDIQTADFEVREMTISQHCMSILYDEVYHIPTERYIKNIKIDISNWKDLLVKIFIYENTYSLPNEVLLEGSNIEPFDLIQEINISDNILLLKGISKKNKYWMEYKIINSKFSIKVFDNG
ncbi:hypothetical protein [Capnocytophaga sp. oral taxon 332]|uniref:hypothetical protein n=1 Tax=Capnocytophaga sp. oral taxon 332 TaxID=712213 RepID=UPI001E5C3E04|nr:hypothetical protein [Capnocytophaga sp. oral taxon 332]